MILILSNLVVFLIYFPWRYSTFPKTIHMREHCYYVYILTNQLRTVLYTGVTNDLEQRITEHYFQRGQPKSFTGKYHVYYLIYFETFKYVKEAIYREKQIKGWTRQKKFDLINTMNPSLEFLNYKFFRKWPPVDLVPRG